MDQRRACVFCGASPVTAEHIWPGWLARVAEFDANVRHTRVRELGREEVERRTFQAPAFSTKANRVCASCNNGWMSELETAAKPLLTPMIQGRGRSLHRASQTIIAAWAFKTALMFEWAFPPPYAVPPEHYTWLFKERTASPDAKVWLIAYGGKRFATYFRRLALSVSFPSAPHDGSEPNSYGVSMSVGHLAFRVFGTSLPGGITIRHEEQFPLLPIWPLMGSTTFAPRPALSDHGLVEWAESLPGDRHPQHPA